MITARDFFDQAQLREELEIVARLYRLRKQRRIGVVLADQGRYWIAAEETDPWGTKVRYTVQELKNLCDRIERKPPSSETRIADTREEWSA